ncbi:MAG: DMT family transporter [Clostridia bacterium]|nr:DMT family transporter [Clostridia bacterium]
MSNQLKGSLCLLAAALVWGLAFSAQSNAMLYIQPFTFVFLRSTITCLVLVAAMPLFRKLSGHGQQSAPPLREHLRPGIIIGLFLVAATILQQVGLVYTTPAKSGFVTALYIVIVPLLGIFRGQRVRVPIWIGLALSLTGMILLCVQDDLSIGIGDLFTLGSAVMFSFQILAVSRYASGRDALILSALQFATCAVVAGVIAFIVETPRVQDMLACWSSILYVAVFSGAIGYTLQMVGQKHTDPTLASLLMCLESVFAALGGWVLLGQALMPRELLGCALMLSASVIAQLPEKRRLAA